jgi:hypothetical protein
VSTSEHDLSINYVIREQLTTTSQQALAAKGQLQSTFWSVSVTQKSHTFGCCFVCANGQSIMSSENNKKNADSQEKVNGNFTNARLAYSPDSKDEEIYLAFQESILEQMHGEENLREPIGKGFSSFMLC